LSYEDRVNRQKKTRRSSKPECFGDVEVYDTDDEECQDCPVKAACRVVVDKKIDRELEEVGEERRKKRKKRKELQRRRESSGNNETEEEWEEWEEPEKGATFGEALAHNSFLSATSAVLREADRGVRSIPKLRYPTPWRRRK